MNILSIGELVLACYGGATIISNIAKSRKKIPQNTIAKIQLYGAITGHNPLPNKSMGKTITPDSIEILVKKALKNNSKGIIFEIDSPGGTVFPSKEISDYVKEIKVPKIALVKDCAASGAYWIASACDKIVANPFSIVGSIGVISPHIEISKLAEKYGVNYDGVKSGEYKDMGSMFRPYTDKEREILQEKLDFIHGEFVKGIAKNRNMKVSEVKKLANGLTYYGKKARQLGLVDKLGGFKEAVSLIEKAGKFKHSKVVPYRMGRSALLSRLGMFAEGIGESFAEGVCKTLSQYNKPDFK